MLKRTALFIALAASPLLSVASEMPDVRIGPFTFQDAPIAVALGEMLKETSISLVLVDDVPGTISATNVSGKLSVVVGKLCAYSGAKCDYENGAIVVRDRAKMAGAPRPQLPVARAAIDKTAMAPDQVKSAVAASATLAVVAPLSVQIRNGEGVRSVLSRNAEKLGIKLAWSLQEDRIASRDMTFTGTRDELLNEMLTVFQIPGYLVDSTRTLFVVKE